MDSGERRKWQGLEHELRVVLQVQGPTSSRTIQALGTHLSPEGLFVMMADPPAPDTRVRVTVGGEAPDSVCFSESGVVVNLSAPSDASEGSGAGIALAEAGPAWRELYALLSG